MTVPNQFASRTTAIPLSELDANFNTPITIGNTPIQLGNTVTTLNNMTLANVTVSSYNASSAVTPEANGGTGTTTGYYGFKNRIINGAMMIDQRNAGASVNNATGTLYTVDRWQSYGAASGKFSIQQNAGSVTPPTGFVNYLGVTSLSSYTIGTTESFQISQNVEGLNVADLGWGAAGASSVTLSFWVRSSLTGTFGGALQNGSYNYSYPFSYTINSANTWEQKTITIAGPTAGTWLKTNGIGIVVNFSLGIGSTYSGTAGSWAATNYGSATGATSVVGTSGATLYITGVQLEKGSTATSFDYRPYGTELAMCQRYYESTVFYIESGLSAGGARGCFASWAVKKRATPSTITLSGTTGSPNLAGLNSVNGSGVYNNTGSATYGTISGDAEL